MNEAVGQRNKRLQVGVVPSIQCAPGQKWMNITEGVVLPLSEKMGVIPSEGMRHASR